MTRVHHLHRRPSLWLAPLFVLPCVVACSDDDDDDDSPNPLVAAAVAEGWLLSANEASVQGAAQELTPAFTVSDGWEVGGNQGIDLDRIANLYHANDRDAPGTPGSVVVFAQAFERASGDVFDTNRDRVIGGAGTTATGLVEPKGVQLVQHLGLLLVADFGAGDVKVFGSAAGADAPPLATVAVAAAPWDLVYVDDDDRLFVSLSDGTVAVFDDFSTDFGAGGAARTIVPADSNGVTISDSLRGIAYSRSTDRLVVTDVGAVVDAADIDGSLYVFTNASAADGPTIPSRRVEGAKTLLRDPTGLALSGTSAVVADPQSDQILVYANILTATVADRAPTNAVTATNPQAIVPLFELPELGEEVSDIDSTATSLEGLMAVSNPTAAPFGAISGFDLDLAGATTTFAANDALAPDVIAPESLVFDRNGDGYLTFNDVGDVDGDPTTVGGILVVGRLASQRDGDDFDAARDRMIIGPTAGLVSPKGLDVTATGELIVADADGAIAVFSTQADGDAPRLFEVTDMGDPARNPWSVDYDPSTDRLYAACDDGTVAVWDDFLAEGLATGGSTLAAPDRVIVPADSLSAQISTNLRGLVHDASTDTLYLADVGPTIDGAADGSLYVIADASTADGLTPVVAEVTGPVTTLVDPSALAWDGANLYVADQGAGAILRWDAFESISGEDEDIAPDASIAFDAVDSIVLVPSTLAP